MLTTLDDRLNLFFVMMPVVRAMTRAADLMIAAGWSVEATRVELLIRGEPAIPAPGEPGEAFAPIIRSILTRALDRAIDQATRKYHPEP